MARLWPTGGLWRHRDFLKLWSAETISVFGGQFTALALPLVAVIVLDASAFAVSALFVVTFLPFILFAIPAGVWIDRMRRRPILIASDLARGALLLTIPAAWALDVLTIWQLYAVGFLTGIGTVFFDVSYQSYLPSLVPRDRLVEGNSKLEISRSASQIGGPGAAGGVIGAVGAPLAILVDAISFLVAALFLLRIRTREVLPAAPADGTARPSMLADAKAGIGYVVRHPFLRPISICTGTSNFFFSMATALLVVYAVRELGLSAAMLGIAFSLANAGPLLGAFGASRITGRVGVGRTLLLTSIAFSLAPLFLVLARPGAAMPFLVAFGLVGGFAAVVYNITQVSFRQAITPERMQGRMNAVIRFLVWGTMPLGSLAGGALGTWIGLRPAITVAAVGALFTFVPILLSPVRSIREMPEPLVEEDVAAETPLAGGVIAPPAGADA